MVQPLSSLKGEDIYWNLDEKDLIWHCLERDACLRAANGAVVAYSGAFTGRTPKDKYIVRDDTTDPQIWWDNVAAMPPETFEHVHRKVSSDLDERPKYVVDTLAGADPQYQIRVRFILDRAYHALFVRQLLIKPTAEELDRFEPDWTVSCASKLDMDPQADSIRSRAVIALDLSGRRVAVAGTQYAGELKKSVFTIMNYLLPLQGVLSMHCSANIGRDGDTALFFGLSGTGKTTLSADPERDLIGDDEHGWSDGGVFNVEGGCYAKCIDLSQVKEPEIWDAISEGAVLENVILDARGVPDYGNRKLTENTRAAYPLSHISNAVHPSVGGHPKNIVFLTCDALGLLPPISRLTPVQAMEYFLNGYTAKVAGTEAGVTEPTVTFSTCFGQPFFPLPPKVYGNLLHDRISQHEATVWLLNTGWTGGAYGTGHRISLADTRTMLKEALAGELENAAYKVHPIFGLHMPTACEGVPDEILNPRETWADKEEYDARAGELQNMFQQNAERMRAYGT